MLPVHRLLDLDDLHEAWPLAVEIVTTATKLDRRQATARLRRWLEDPGAEPDLDDRRALFHMAEILDQLRSET